MATEREDDILENGKARGGVVGDMMKKALYATLGAVFMTEESVRAYVTDAKLPRDIRNSILSNASQAKEQFFGYLAKELSGLVAKSDLPKVARTFLEEHTIEIEAKIRFRGDRAPEITSSARATADPGTHAPAPPPSAPAAPQPAAPEPAPGPAPGDPPPG